MALNFPSSPTNGQTYTDPNSVLWRYDGVKWNVVLSTTNKLFNGVKVKTTSNNTLTTTETALGWDTSEYDVGDYYNPSEPTKVTINDNGYFRISGVAFTGPQGSGSSYTFKLRKNGSTTLATVVVGSNQAVAYDEIVQLYSGDYLEILASESTAAGVLFEGMTMEVTRKGLSLGVGVTAGDAFSGIRTTLSANVSMTSTPTAVSWSTPAFDANGDANGATYWDVGTPSRLTIKTAGYFRLNASLLTTSAGSANSYTFTIKKNNSTNLSTIDLGANDSTVIDETFNFALNDYIELFVDNSGSTGALVSNSFIQIVRIGI